MRVKVERPERHKLSHLSSNLHCNLFSVNFKYVFPLHSLRFEKKVQIFTHSQASMFVSFYFPFFFSEMASYLVFRAVFNPFSFIFLLYSRSDSKHFEHRTLSPNKPNQTFENDR
jgi:hypothetical protein